MPRNHKDNDLHGLMTRIFDVPLMVTRVKAIEVAAVVAERNGVTIAIDDEDKADETKTPSPAKSGYEVLDGTAVIPVYGSLVAKTGTMRPYSGMTGYDGISKSLANAMRDDNVQRVMFDIDSHGGEVTGCFELAEEIMSYRGIKPMYSMVAGSGRSAAYAIACAADRVAATPSATVGSIGVLAMHYDCSAAYEKHGIKPTIVYAGAHKMDFSDSAPLNRSALERLQETVNETYAQFVSFVAKARGLPPEKVRATEALTYRGQHAVDAGLVNAIVAQTGARQFASSNMGELTKQEASPDPKATTKETPNMPWKRLCERLALESKATDEENEEQLVGLVKKLTQKAQAADANTAFCGLHKVKSLDEMTAKTQNMVPREALVEVEKKLLQIAAAARVSELMQPPNCKITAAFKDWAMDFYMRDKDGFEKVVAGMPVGVPSNDVPSLEKPTEGSASTTIPAEERAELERDFGKEKVAEVLAAMKPGTAA